METKGGDSRFWPSEQANTNQSDAISNCVRTVSDVRIGNANE
jgi:hypothetical protein